MSSSDVLRSQRVLDKIGGRLGITEAGKQWLLAAVDPFHDTPLDVRGYPDVNEASSVLQVVKFSAPISAPTGLATDATWDCHIHSFPWEQNCQLIGGNFGTSNNGTPSGGYGPFLIGNNNVTPQAGGSFTLGAPGFGGLAYDSVPSGDVTFDYAAAFGLATVPFENQLRPYMNGEFRIIAKGFEVINTTSELNIQGLVTTYRQPCEPIDSAKATPVIDNQTSNGGVYTAGFVDLVSTAMPPVNVAEALLLDGSKQWKAKEGCYVVPTLCDDQLTPGLNSTASVLKLSNSDPNRGTPPTAGYGWAITIPTQGSFPGNNFWYPAASGTGVTSIPWRPWPAGSNWMQNFNHAGAYFTGLSFSTTLQLQVIYYIERFPTQQDSDLVVLARHSCREDCVARELYSEIIREMPTGVPQKFNSFGEWFNDAVSAAADFVSPVLSAIPHPYAQGAAAAVNTAKGISKAIMGKKEAPGQTYSAQGANVSSTAPKKKKVMEKVIEVITKKKKAPMKKK